jgi:GH15 family glucan-1,4-alpha-glucosidase
MNFIPLEDLAMIGDRRTVAFVSKKGEICWYCPKRFDADPIFASLLDPEKGGSWSLCSQEELGFSWRSYLGNSAVLESSYKGREGSLNIIDFMPVTDGEQGIFRKIENLGVEAYFEMKFFSSPPEKEISESKIIKINKDFYILSSENMEMKGNIIRIPLKKEGESWVYFSHGSSSRNDLSSACLLDETMKYWAELGNNLEYQGPFEDEMKRSLLALRLLTDKESGAVIAAATTSLPEVIGGERNYDYRYVWLRDTAMIVSALVRAGDTSDAPEKFLDFICDSHHKNENSLLYPFFTIDKRIAPPKKINEKLKGYFYSSPVVTGNDANEQLQLDANSNVLIAAKLIYKRIEDRPHWETITKIANFLCEKWQESDHGIWEESEKYQYTTSKVIVACALEYISKYSEEPKEKKYWCETAKKIRAFIADQCISSEGYYKLAAEVEDVDVSAALFPIWGFVDADDPIVIKTIEKLETDYMEKNLFRRRLVCFDAKKEGAFLAGSIWVAQYYIMRNNLDRFKEIITAVLEYSNDLGFFSEEADLKRNKMLGNIPQTFVHASFIGAVIDYKNAME